MQDKQTHLKYDFIFILFGKILISCKKILFVYLDLSVRKILRVTNFNLSVKNRVIKFFKFLYCRPNSSFFLIYESSRKIRVR